MTISLHLRQAEEDFYTHHIETTTKQTFTSITLPNQKFIALPQHPKVNTPLLRYPTLIIFPQLG